MKKNEERWKQAENNEMRGRDRKRSTRYDRKTYKKAFEARKSLVHLQGWVCGLSWAEKQKTER
jgi:hypothetical protein